MERKQTISERINARFREPEGQIFKDGKWRFWFLFLIGLGIINAILAALIFAGSVGGIAMFVGGLVGWVLVGTLYYSDSEDTRLARGVSVLDSITLCFVITHFCFLMWVYGHLLTLQKADAKYDVEMAVYNEKQENLQAGNVKLGELGLAIAQETTKAERLRKQTAYQMRRAAEAGARIPAVRQSSGDPSPSLSAAKVELQKPKAPEQSSSDFLAKWDAWIRIAYFGELILAAITLIYIRNRSAAFNAKNAPQVNYGSAMGIPAPVAALRRSDEKIATGVATDLDRLRAHLKAISFYHPGRWFKADPLESGDGLWVRLCERRQGREKTIAKVKWNNRVFAELDRPDFTERLTQRLIDAGFPIGGER